MNKYLEQVEQFHDAFRYKSPSPTVPNIEDHATNNLREDLLREDGKILKGPNYKRVDLSKFVQ